MNKAFVVILNFNGGDKIIKCLNSLKSEKCSVIVVDNNSKDSSVQLIKEQFPKVKIILNQENLGFAAGNNKGIKYALKRGAEIVLLLNQDAVIGKGSLKILIENGAGIVAPVIKFKRKKRWVYDYGGKIDWRIGRPNHLEKDKLIKKMNFLPDYVSGCAMLIRKSVFDKIGLLDEKFFLYFEDADYCLKAKKAGFGIAVEPKAGVRHNLVEKEKKPLKQHLILLKSNLIFINRYLSGSKKPFAYLYLLFLFFKIIWNQLT